MASIKSLKKQIKDVSEYLTAETLFSKAEIEDKDVAQISTILANIADFEEEYRRRAQHYDGKNNPKLVKEYFRKLYAAINEKIEEIRTQIVELNK